MDGYKDKLRTAMGSSKMPGMFFNWGGGSLDDYVKAGKLVELDDFLGTHFLSSALEAGKVDDKLVGVPCRGTQPVFLFYNKKVFSDAGVEPPKTYAELTNLVKVFKGKGITPFALAGNASSLVDGADVGGVPRRPPRGAWALLEDPGRRLVAVESDPAILKTAQMIKQLVDDGAFGKNFGSVNYRRRRHLDATVQGQGGHGPDGLVGVRRPAGRGPGLRQERPGLRGLPECRGRQG
ncbi:extracellular solute-binding protein [Streptomyces sp. L7]